MSRRERSWGPGEPPPALRPATEEGWDELYTYWRDRHWWGVLVRLQAQIQVEDAAEEITYLVFETFRKRLPTLSLPGTDPVRLLYRYAIYRTKDWFRKAGRRSQRETSLGELTEEGHGEALQTRDPAEEIPARVDLQRAMAKLSAADRALLEAVYFCGVPVQEIAEELGVPPNTASQRLVRARERLAELLSEGFGDD